jgi:hypothetical protein
VSTFVRELGSQRVLVIKNFSSQPERLALDFLDKAQGASDLLTGRTYPLQPGGALTLEPDQTLWLAVNP